MRLPMKGSHTYKEDNPLIILTSNQPLSQHCGDKWFNNESKRDLFVSTLGVRVKEIEIPSNLFCNFHEFEELLTASVEFVPLQKLTKLREPVPSNSQAKG